LKGRRFGNIVLLAADRQLPIDELAQRSGRAAYPYRVVTGDRLHQLVGGAVPFTDSDSERSPAPTITHFR
jgi:hypothetical protein